MKVFNKIRCLFLAAMLTVSTANVFAQNTNVTGKVTDQSGLPVIGATVMLSSNQSVGTLTDMDGNYSINVPSNSSLIFSCVGYATQTVALAGRSVLDIVFAEDTEFLEETVVIGYGTQKKKLITGATINISGEDIQKQNTTNALGALYSSVPGVNIVQANGLPGSGYTITVRGIGTTGSSGPLIVIDGVFSMEGDLAKLPEIVELKKKYNCSIMVDEAHGLGVFGEQGRGVCNHFGLTDEVDLIMGTFSKSLASIGGFIAGDWDTINYLRHTSRTYIFSASNTPAATAAAQCALHIIQNEPERIAALWEVTNYALSRFKEEGFEIGDTESPIIPLFIRNTEKALKAVTMALEEGIFVTPVIQPAVPANSEIIRFALMATHTFEQLDEAIEKMTKIFKALDVIQ